jgi:mRNA interferase YafQ
MAKGAQAKRASHPRICDYTKAFSKDWTRLSGLGRHDMNRLKAVILLLIANDAPLGPEWKDHPLKGEWSSRSVMSAAISC